MVRVRFAPSPTGMLHLGGARTALFNYLFARHYEGKILLRIEDTDLQRSSREFERAQIEDLSWLGISFDEGPYRQSERAEIYEKAAERLEGKGFIYEAADESGRRALYFRPPERSGVFRDRLRGEVRFSKVGDFVIRKSDGTPSYNFAVVVDDAEMGITHVIRGEEHLSNTGRQALLYRALGGKEPEFVHLGVILGPDGKKLSKRHGAASVADYRREGYLPEALVSYLALLGWSHPEGREDFSSLEDLVREFDPSRLGASPAIFDADRLLVANARRIRGLSLEELLGRLEPFLGNVSLPEERRLMTAEAIQSELHKLSEAPHLIQDITGSVDADAFAGDLPESSVTVYAHTCRTLEGREIKTVEEARGFVGELRTWAKENGIRTRELLHPLRLALTGRNSGPEMPYLFAVLGPEEARLRIEAAKEARLKA